MISPFNQPACKYVDCQDFTLEHYQLLLRKAKDNYEFVNYGNIPVGGRFILWRHDCDFSINRAKVLAQIENKEEVQSTFFLNPNCKFYNLFEKTQIDIVRDILKLRHGIGLHLDAAIYEIHDESSLIQNLQFLSQIFQRFFGVFPAAFSFHNPSHFDLKFDADTYGGLINCYSRKFKTEMGYCSDSNGYWRYRSLIDVLTEATDPCLQVLTHPGWWQDVPMPPRQRICHCSYGRARATMRLYDKELENFGRENFSGSAQAIRFLRPVHPDIFELCDFLWNYQRFETLFLELWRLHEMQVNRLCKVFLVRDRGLSKNSVETIFVDNTKCLDGWQLFQTLLGHNWHEVTGGEESEQQHWVTVRDQLIHGRFTGNQQKLEDGCVYLCGIIESIANWRKSLGIP